MLYAWPLLVGADRRDDRDELVRDQPWRIVGLIDSTSPDEAERLVARLRADQARVLTRGRRPRQDRGTLIAATICGLT
jgi:hypothetical protein